jgi:hypothetical protein
MTNDDMTPVPAEPEPTPAEPTQPVPIPPAPPAVPAAAPRTGGPSLGHIVLGAVLVLVGVGWLLEALDLADVPWRLLLPSVLIVVGVALTLGSRTGRHGGLVAVGVVLTVAVLLAGVIEVLIDIPLARGIGEETRRPATVVNDQYRWGVGKMTIDLRSAPDLAGEEIAASVVVGELVVIVPDDLPLVITARSGVGEVQVLDTSTAGFDARLDCAGSATGIRCDGDGPPGELSLQLDLEVAIGRVEVRR